MGSFSVTSKDYFGEKDGGDDSGYNDESDNEQQGGRYPC